MGKEDVLTELIKLKNNAENMQPFKGKTEIVNMIQGSMDFIRSHKVDSSLMEKLLKEREKDFEVGLKREGEKYAEKERQKIPAKKAQKNILPEVDLVSQESQGEREMSYIWIIIAVSVWVLGVYFLIRFLKDAMTDQLPDPPENICLLETHGWDACGCEQCFERKI